MQVNYTLETSELDINFLNSLKEIFKNKYINITVTDEYEEDEKLASAIDEGLKSQSVSYDDFSKIIDAN